jgi:hypothetical protein
MDIDKHELFLFVKEQTGENEIDIDTELQDDLGIRGDDAVDFLIAYGKRYSVDVSEFMAADYFGSEGSGILSHLVNKLFGIPEKRKRFTVGHLYKGIQAGRLDEEVINA